MDRAADAADPMGWDGTPLRHVASTDLLGGSDYVPPHLRGRGHTPAGPRASGIISSPSGIFSSPFSTSARSPARSATSDDGNRPLSGRYMRGSDGGLHYVRDGSLYFFTQSPELSRAPSPRALGFTSPAADPETARPSAPSARPRVSELRRRLLFTAAVELQTLARAVIARRAVAALRARAVACRWKPTPVRQAAATAVQAFARGWLIRLIRRRGSNENSPQASPAQPQVVPVPSGPSSPILPPQLTAPPTSRRRGHRGGRRRRQSGAEVIEVEDDDDGRHVGSAGASGDVLLQLEQACLAGDVTGDITTTSAEADVPEGDPDDPDNEPDNTDECKDTEENQDTRQNQDTGENRDQGREHDDVPPDDDPSHVYHESYESESYGYDFHEWQNHHDDHADDGDYNDY